MNPGTQCESCVPFLMRKEEKDYGEVYELAVGGLC